MAKDLKMITETTPKYMQMKIHRLKGSSSFPFCNTKTFKRLRKNYFSLHGEVVL